MAADEFCRGMEYDICAVLDRSYKVRCCKCIIYNKRDFMLMCDICKSFNINYIRVRVSKSLDVNCFCIFLNCILNFFQIEDVYECCCDSVVRKCMLKKVERSSVNVLCRYDMISLLSQVLDCICDSCCSCLLYTSPSPRDTR